MNETKSSWSFVEISPDAREAAERAASAAGMDLDAWLAQLIKYTSAMELKGNEPRAPARSPAPPARPLSAPASGTAPSFAAAPAAPAPASPVVLAPALTLTIAPAKPAAAPDTLPTGGDRPSAPPPFSLPNPAARATVSMPQRPAAPAASLALRPAPMAATFDPGRPPAAAAQAAAAAPAKQAQAATALALQPQPPALPAQPPDAGGARPEPARPDPGRSETGRAEPAPRMVATDMLHPSRFAALASPKEDDIQAALDKWRASGMLEPLIVRPRGGAPGQFEIISGIDRWHAARRAYVRQIPVLVRDAGDQEALELGLVDQLRRAPLSPLAEANIYLRLLNDAGLDTERAARLAGKPAAHVATMVRILNLPKPVRAMLESGEITVMHARALLEAPNPELLARDIVEKRLDIYQTEQLVRVSGRAADTVDASLLVDEPTEESIVEMGTAPFARATGASQGPAARRPAEPGAEAPPAEGEARPAPASARRPSEARTPREGDVISTDLLERNIANTLGVRCAISERNGVGVITLHYTSREELVRILSRINGGGTAG